MTILLQLPESPSNKPQKTNHLVDSMDLSIHTTTFHNKSRFFHSPTPCTSIFKSLLCDLPIT